MNLGSANLGIQGLRSTDYPSTIFRTYPSTICRSYPSEIRYALTIVNFTGRAGQAGKKFSWAPRGGIFDPEGRHFRYATTGGAEAD